MFSVVRRICELCFPEKTILVQYKLMMSAVLVFCLASTMLQAAADEAVHLKPREPVKLPGLVVDFEKRCVDLEATVCLDKGLLELVACTKGSKEHEAIVAVTARPMHIHTGLLLLGIENGHPAGRRQVVDESTGEKRWVNQLPQGDAVDVFLVTKEKDNIQERPISEFVIRSDQSVDEVDGEVLNAPADTLEEKPATPKTKQKAKPKFTSTFLFAGSLLRDNGPGPRKYLAELSGNVISIATFGDELLCLSDEQTQDNSALMWQVKPKSLPKVGSSVTLRLRPQQEAKADKPQTVKKPSGQDVRP